MFLQDELIQRGVPDVLISENGEKITEASQWERRRQEIIDILCREEYGYAPPAPASVSYEINAHHKDDYGGKVKYSYMRLKVPTDNGIFAFPIHKFIPATHGKEKAPVILHIAFRPNVPDSYMPVEEITDRGFALISFCYNDITTDVHDDFRSGLACMYDRKKYNWGKISMWAWAASRVMDYLQTLSSIDFSKIAVVGHSRLGKTALLCGALDERFQYIISNDSGCSGSAITRGKTGEHVDVITRHFPHWFCPKYASYAGNEEAMPFDQHYLLAACAPRKVCIGTAEEDSWADPFSEYLSAYAASPAFELNGRKGFIGEDRIPRAGDIFHEGSIGFHMRGGNHFFSRYDWNRYMDFINRESL